MPFRRKRIYKRKRRYSRRSYGRKRRRINRNKLQMQVMRGPSYMPDQLLTTHRLVAEGNFNFVLAQHQNRQFSGNGLFQPLAPSSIQPGGFGPMTTIYIQYAVTACKVKIMLNNSSGEPMRLGLFPVIDGVGLGNVTAEDAATNPLGKLVYLGPNGSGSNKSIGGYVKTAKVVGQPNLQSYNLWGDATSNPSRTWSWVLVGSYPQVETRIVYYSVDLTYYVRWTRKELVDPTG